jgi:preprotein translocase subunit SecE
MKVENVEPKQVLLMLALMVAIIIAFAQLAVKLMA